MRRLIQTGPVIDGNASCLIGYVKISLRWGATPLQKYADSLDVLQFFAGSNDDKVKRVHKKILIAIYSTIKESAYCSVD
jgi:hypothetical protein